jgi:presenilin 1
MAFSSFTLLFWVGGYFIQVILETCKIPFDAISFVFLLFNSATVGTIAMWTSWTPFVLKQAYLVLVAVVIAVLFTRIPAWTTWFLLGALVIYDLCAVLLPGGPLKALVELAMERNEAIPALVYESRPTTREKTGGSSGSGGDLATQGEGVEIRNVTEANSRGAERGRRRTRERQRQATADQEENEMETASTSMASPDEMTMEESNLNNSNSENGAEEQEEGQEVSPNEPLIKAESTSSGQRQVQGSRPPVVLHHEEEEEEGEMGLPDSIKLGLGDFIFYSVLVGQASLYDMTTVYVCYLAIMAGLGATLLLLAIYQKALPALPISITLGVVFYFCTRYFLDPTVTPMSLSLLYV